MRGGQAANAKTLKTHWCHYRYFKNRSATKYKYRIVFLYENYVYFIAVFTEHFV